MGEEDGDGGGVHFLLNDLFLLADLAVPAVVRTWLAESSF